MDLLTSQGPNYLGSEPAMVTGRQYHCTLVYLAIQSLLPQTRHLPAPKAGIWFGVFIYKRRAQGDGLVWASRQNGNP